MPLLYQIRTSKFTSNQLLLSAANIFAKIIKNLHGFFQQSLESQQSWLFHTLLVNESFILFSN